MPAESSNPSIETLMRIDAICDQYESALKRGENPELSKYLEKAPADEHSLLFKDLVAIKLELHAEDSFEGVEEELIKQYSDEKETISQLISAAKSRKYEESEDTRFQKSDLTDPEIDDQKHPRIIGRFKIVKMLGKGGFGTVYKAVDTDSDQFVAIKIPLNSTLKSEENLKRFVREGEIAAGLDHPGICRVYEVASYQEIPYIVMKYVDGPSMADIHKQMNSKNRLMNIPKSVSLIQNIGEAIEYAHQKGVIHRDLKPANIIWDKEESNPVITDFGLARYWKNNESDLTLTGQGMGTPAYIAPEQARGHNKDLSKQVDVYSLGVIFYELLCGQRPFPGKDFDVVIQKNAEDPPPPSHFRPEIDSQLDAICLTVIARSTEDRFKSVQEFLDALEKYQAGDDFSFPKRHLVAGEKEESFEDEDDLPKLRPITQNHKNKIAEKSKKTLAEFRDSFNLDFDPYYRWLGITSKQRPLTHYQLLGIGTKEQDREAIFNAAERQKMNVKAFQGDTEGYVVARILYEIEEARFILLDDDYRSQYDAFMKEKKKKASWKRRYQKWRKRALQNSELPKEYVYITQSSGIVEEFLLVFSIILAGFVLMAWVSFTYWPKPEHRNNNQPAVAVNIPVKNKPVAPKPLRKRIALGNPKKKKLPPKKQRVEEKPVDPNAPFDIAKFKLTDKWVDLLPSIDTEKLTLQGNWKKNNGMLIAGINNKKSTLSNSIHLPVKAPLSYQLKLEFDQKLELESDRKDKTISASNTETAFIVSMPVANKRCQLAIYRDWVQLANILHEEKRSYNVFPVGNNGGYSIVKNNYSVGRYNDHTRNDKNVYGFGSYVDDGSIINLINSEKYLLLINVKCDGKMAVIQVSIDGRLAMDWVGPIEALADMEDYGYWNNKPRTGIALASNALLVNYHHIQIKKGDSHKIIIPESLTPLLKSPYYKKPPELITRSVKQIKFSQKAASKTNNVKINIKNSVGMQMTLIPSGTFIMGSEKEENGINLPHPVKISKPFYMGKHEITRGQFRQFIKETKYETSSEINGGWGYDRKNNKYVTQSKLYSWKNVGFHQTDKHPVTDVSWNDSKAFCKWLSKKENKKYRLPTEAEWEYSCRAGTATFYYHEGKGALVSFENQADLEFRKLKPNGDGWGGKKSDGYAFTAPVGKYKPNPFGLHDMHGNIREWCDDTLIPYAYYLISEKVAIDPHVTTQGAIKVLRGGTWHSGHLNSNASHRNAGHADAAEGLFGFRVVREL